jgi:hypothetical protein
MSAPAIRAKFEAVREAAFGSITTSFTVVGIPIAPAVRHCIVQNFTNVILDFSISQEGTVHHFSLAPSVAYVFDVTANETTTEGFFLGAGQSLWVRYRTGAPATSGFVQFSTVFGQN